MEKVYVMTERAHFMCPNMCFGMLVELPVPYKKERVEETIQVLSEAHPFLRSLLCYEEDGIRLFYDVKGESQVLFEEKENIDTLWEDYAYVFQTEWNPFENGLLKIYTYVKEERLTVLFVVHHLLGDGRCLLQIAKEFAEYYVEGIIPVYVEEKLINCIEDLPPKSNLRGISRLLVKQANKQWAVEKERLEYKRYASFAEKYTKEHPVYHKQYVVSLEEYEQMKKLCRENEITINDLLMAHMYLKTGTEKIIIAVDVRDRLACYRKGAYGNYASAMGIVCKSKTKDVIKKAREVHKIVRKHMADNSKVMLVLSCYLNMDPTLLDAAATSGMGGFDSKAGRFVGGGMFGFTKPQSYSITNLGKITCKDIVSATFIPPASPAAKLTLGVVTVNDNMRMCSSGYEKFGEFGC